MYNTSNNYKSKVYNSKHLLRVFINSNEVESKYVLGCSPSKPLFSNGEFELGTTVTNSIKLKLHKNAVPTTINQIYITSGIEGEEVPIGYFNVDDISKVDDYTVSLKLVDNMVKFESTYDGSEIVYPATLITILQDICTKKGVELGSASFLNMNKTVSVYDNQISAREYISYIAEQADGFATIGRDGKLYINTIGETIAELPISYFKTFKWGEKIKITRVRYEDGVQVFQKGDETGNTVYINQENMYIVDQEQIDNIYDQINGLEVYSFEGTSVIDPALDVGDLLLIDGKYVIYQGSCEYSGKFIANISSKIQCKFREETTTRIPSQKVINRRVQSSMDQENARIQLIAQEQTVQSQRITTVEGKADTTARNLNNFITTTYAQDISNIQQQIDGAIQFWNGAAIPTLNNYPANQWTTEADRVNHQADIYTVIEDVEGELKQGKSYRFDKVNNVWQWIELTDNELSAVQALANSKAKVYVVTPIPPYNVGDLWLKDQELYECIRAKDNAGTFSQSDWQKATKYTDDTKANEVDAKLTTTNQKVSTIELNLESITETVEQTSTGLREVKEELDAEDSFTRQKSIQIEAAEATLDDVYMYGELEQETTTGKNKFDKNAATQGYYIDSTGELVENSSSYVSDYIPVTANQQITMSGNTYIQESYGSKACFYDSNKNFVSYVSIATGNNTYTVPSNASYFRTTVRNVDIDTLQVENGSTATEYEEYTGGIAAPNPDKEMPISVIGENINLLDLSNMEIGTKNGVTLSRNNDGTYHLKGTATNATHFLADYTIPSSWLGKTMTMSSEQVVTWGNVGFKEGTATDKFIIARNGKSKTQEITQDVIETVTKFDIYVPNGNTVDIDVKIKVEEGTIATGYTEYNRGGIDYKVTGDSEKKVTVELPENEFLANIGEYEDYIDSTGVLHKVIGKVVLDGSDDESLPLNSRLTNTLRFDLPILTDGKLINANKVVCNRFTSVYGNTNDYEHCRNSSSSYPTSFIFYINKSRLNGYDDSLTSAQVSELVRAWLKENPLEIYYILETPYNALLEENEIKKYLALPTIKGTNNIEITAPTSATYKRDTELNAVYAKRKYVDEKFAQQEITNESITNTVSSSQILIANNTNSIDEVNNAIAGLNGSTTQIQEDLEATKQELSTQLQQTNTSFQASINEINTTLANGVASTSVKTTTGTFDNEGLHIKKSDSEMESLLNNEGLYVNKGNQNQLTCDKDGVITENLYVRTYLTAGYHRTEGFIENGEKRTGVFYQGGVE